MTRRKYDTIQWTGAQQRVKRLRGPARFRLCACGDRAIGWVYRGGSDEELSDGDRKWSPNPADYDPSCDSCRVRRHMGLGART